MAVIRIKSTHPQSQGDFVEIEPEDFDPEKGHELFEPETEAPSTVVALKEALDAKGIAYPSTAKKADLQALLDAAG